MATLPEPKRQTDLASLWAPFRAKVEALLAAMVGRGFDPILYEARRTQERQDWLYGVGRTHDFKRKPVTWIHRSRHTPGKAADIISTRRGWEWPQFYVALRQEALKLGLRDYAGGTAWAGEGCHVQWGG